MFSTYPMLSVLSSNQTSRGAARGDVAAEGTCGTLQELGGFPAGQSFPASCGPSAVSSSSLIDRKMVQLRAQGQPRVSEESAAGVKNR